MQRMEQALKAGLALGVFALAGVGIANAQATATATAGLQLSAFGGLTGTYTGVALGKNLGITAGIDATFRPFFGVFPSLELRGTYPIHDGRVDSQKNFLGGIKLSKHIGRIQPYGDFMAGSGEIRFNPPYPNPDDTILYQQTASVVLAGGGGADLLVTDHFGVKADFQFQHYDSPVTPSGSVYAKAFTIGVVYRLPFGGLGRRY